MSEPIYIDATMLYRWRHLAPVGIVRLERLLAAHLRNRSSLGPATFVMWERGYRPTTDAETRALDALLSDDPAPSAVAPTPSTITPPPPARGTGPKAALRRAGLRTLGSIPDPLRPLAEQAAWSAATFAVESGRYARRAWDDRRNPSASRAADGVHHRIDLGRGGDLIALGLGWEYLDHEAMFRLRHEHGLRIHMPAFDLIPVAMPQMNAGQSHLVHRYYAEMAHYADTVTSISRSTEAAMRTFFAEEDLPMPHLVTNPLPGLDDAPGAGRTHHRLSGDVFVLSVSTIEVRKNHLLLAKIWSECAREGIALPRLAIVGRVGWDVDELLNWVRHAPELQGLVEIYTDVDDDELVAMYRDCAFTVFPSRIEGWGLPITEALGHGKVCVHTTDPAQFEASQGLMPALHPDDFLGWKAEIVRLSTDPARVAELEQVVADRYRHRTTAEYCAEFEAIIASRRPRS